MNEQEYWDGMRRSWYKLIRQNDYDLQYAADLVYNAISEMLGTAITDPKVGLSYIMHLSRVVHLTCKWVLEKQG